MRTTIKVPNIVDFFSLYPSIEKKKNRIIVRVKQKVYIGYVFAPYIPLYITDIQFKITKDGIISHRYKRKRLKKKLFGKLK